ncbi:MAG TPA: NAD-dependent epimerase/dehydratase family protein [Myxococcota bacterium]|nr:NAD-dependent epimerase/dehydratase family protein [Myxococcota bacterium]
MKVLVTGGNGFIGSALVERLQADGHEVRCLMHRSRDLLDGLDIELAPGSVVEPAGLDAACEGVELVYHLAGSGRAGDWGSRKWFFACNANGTRNMLDAAVRAGAGRFVHMSSLAVHSFTGHVDADESVPADQQKYAYGASKVEAERHVRREGKIECVILRPGVVVFGPRDETAFVHMAPLLEKGRWTHVRGGSPLVCYSYVDNLVNGLLLAGTHPAAAGETFVITDDLRLSWKELISKVIAAFGARERTFSFPAPLARAAGIALEAAFKLSCSRKAPAITDYRTALVSRDFHFSCAKAKQMLGYSPALPLEEGLRRTVEWYRSLKERK